MTATAPDVRAPARTRHDPWPWQAEAYEYARDLRACLLDGAMGSGKSRIAIELVEHDYSLTRIPPVAFVKPFRVLTTCPASVVDVWPEQMAEHAFADWRIWAGEVRGARGPLRKPSITRRAVAAIEADKHAAHARQPFMAVINYEACYSGDLGELTLATPWDVLILDESHRVKSPSGRASRHLAHVARRVLARGGRVLDLTGTMMPHTPLDVWAQFRTLDPTILGGSYRSFCQRFGDAEEIWAAGGVRRTIYKGLREDRREEFNRLIAPLIFSITEERVNDHLGLPETVDVRRSIDLDPPTRRAYDALAKDLIADVAGGVITAANAMVLVLRLAQVASGHATDVDSGRTISFGDGLPEKARLLADVLEDLPLREPVVVFCRFHADLDAVRAVCEAQGRRYGELSGRRRDGLSSRATMGSDVDVLGAQVRSGGVGVDLTRARYGIYFSLGFELADYLQSRKRLHRPGQTRPVTYVHLTARDTIESAIYGALRRRQEVVEAVLEALRNG
jgi:SNF2 family DNA or RNA helicase